MEKRTPILVVTNDKWSRDTYVVFNDDEIIDNLIPSDWIDSRIEKFESEYPVDRDEIAQGMEEEFFDENDTVDNFWPEKQILQAGTSFYSYTEIGEAKYLGDYDSVDEIEND